MADTNHTRLSKTVQHAMEKSAVMCSWCWSDLQMHPECVFESRVWCRGCAEGTDTAGLCIYNNLNYCYSSSLRKNPPSSTEQPYQSTSAGPELCLYDRVDVEYEGLGSKPDVYCLCLGL